MQKTRTRSGRKGGYHGYTLSQAEKILSGKEKIVDEPYVFPQSSLHPRIQRLQKSPPKTLQDIIAHKEDYIVIYKNRP